MTSHHSLTGPCANTPTGAIPQLWVMWRHRIMSPPVSPWRGFDRQTSATLFMVMRSTEYAGAKRIQSYGFEAGSGSWQYLSVLVTIAIASCS